MNSIGASCRICHKLDKKILLVGTANKLQIVKSQAFEAAGMQIWVLTTSKHWVTSTR